MICPSCGTNNEPGRKFCGECGGRLAVTCASCGAVNGPGARFCGECGSPLAVGPAAPSPPADGPRVSPPIAQAVALAAPVAERRLVSVLFADLVGFTTISEGRDPEEVRELLSRYFEQASEVIDRYGGTVEKFIGDAVMAVWGTPTAHEDDAERAVRAALDLLDAIPALAPGLQARAGVLTGEAAVTLGARGQGMVAGDLVNTAARLQSVAAPGTVLVGEATQLATSGAIAYEGAGEATLKGKEAPVGTWRALRVIAERGGRGRGDRFEAPFVGRDAELRLLKDLFHATSRERRVRLVSITGQGGIGKSRLAWEFLKYIDGVVESVMWHEGRSPAYGEGLTFWALGEMVRSRAGLLDTDDQATTRTRIAEMTARYVPDADEQRRVEGALLALLGVGETQTRTPAELFSAWRTFFERLSAEGVVALVFEDLQWADSGLLDFIDHVLEWSRGVPILIITLARPDLLERRPEWGAGRRNFLALDVQPLDDGAMRQLLAGFAPGLPASAVEAIVRRADGIPLYAVETIRMLVADGRLRSREEGGFEPAGELGELAVPNTLHALIAARLDGLDPAERALVQDAAVLGQSFTIDALAIVAGLDRLEVEGRLDRLVRGDLLRQEVDTRSPERGQFAFVQALIREVAYSTLSLRDRRARHLAAARFFESLADDELAAAVAAHYMAAYRVSSEGPESEALAAQARVSLRAAADRAIALGAPSQALAFLEQAIEVAAGDEDRADLLERAAETAGTIARSDVAIPFLERAAELRRMLGDRPAIARNRVLVGDAYISSRRREEGVAQLQAAWEEFRDLEDDPAVIKMTGALASGLFLAGHYDRARELADQALAAAERHGLLRIATQALITKGQAAFNEGRSWEARALVTGARQLTEEGGLEDLQLTTTLMLTSFSALDDPAGALDLQRDAIALARRLGRRGMEITILGNASEDARRTGDWAWAIQELEGAAQLDVDPGTLAIIDTALAFFRIHRGEIDEARLEHLRERIDEMDDRDVAAGTFDLSGTIAYAAGEWARAATAWVANAGASDLNEPYALPKAARAAVLARDATLAKALLERLGALGARGRAVDADRAVIKAGLAALEGDHAGATAGYRAGIEGFRDVGLAWDEALASVEAGYLLGPSDPEVLAWLERARSILTRLGAVRMIDQLDRLLAPSAAVPAGSDA
jgi:class 3 adenylate cyclase/tetratricopeptide (TPR) repeat protein